MIWDIIIILDVYITSKGFRQYSYSVPATRVLTWLSKSWMRRASPKSAILGLKFLSKRMLLDLMSRCMIRTSDSSCRYASPRAIPRAMLNLVDQLRCIFMSHDPGATSKHTCTVLLLSVSKPVGLVWSPFLLGHLYFCSIWQGLWWGMDTKNTHVVRWD